MSWLSSIIGGVSKAVGSVGTAIDKDIIKPLAPVLITGAAAAGLGALTGGAAFGSQSILADIFKTGVANGNFVPINGTGTSPAMSLTGGDILGGIAGGVSGGVAAVTAVPADIAGYAGQIAAQVTTQGEGYLSAASHNIEAQGIRLGIYAVLILFMLGAFVALLLPDEQQSVNIMDSAGHLSPAGE